MRERGGVSVVVPGLTAVALESIRDRPMSNVSSTPIRNSDSLVGRKSYCWNRNGLGIEDRKDDDR